MTLQSDIDDLGKLNKKEPGHLIRHDDWNTLVNAVIENLQATKAIQDLDLPKKIDDLSASLTQAIGTLKTELTGELDKLKQKVAPLLANYIVTMQASKDRYTEGQLAEITVKVTALDGTLVAPKPWVDFVSTWGTLYAASGFASSNKGESGNSLSVQVNDQGVAKVLLSAPTNASFSVSDLGQVQAVMMMTVGGGAQQTVADAILNASTPQDAMAVQAFNILNAEYDKPGNSPWTTFVNAVQMSPNVVGAAQWGNAGTFKDRFATVLAFARPDGLATSPDGARGAASIQLTFREVVSTTGPGYVVPDKDDKYKKDIHGIFELAVENPLDKLDDHVHAELHGKGYRYRVKYLNTVREVLHELASTTTKADVAKVVKQAEAGVAMQLASETGGWAGIPQSAEQGTAMMQSTFAQAADTKAVGQQVSQVAATAQTAKGLAEAVSLMEGRIQNTESLGRNIQSSLLTINESVRNLKPLDETTLQTGVNRISADIANIKAKLKI